MWKINCAATRGRGHELNDVPCQDKTYSYASKDSHIAVLADGAGSAKLSHYGAEFVTEHAAGLLEKNFDNFYSAEDGNEIKKMIVAETKQALFDYAETLDCEPKDLASTLLAVAVHDNRFLLIHLGDGVIGYSNKTGEIKVATHPINGEHANETIFTTSDDAEHGLQIIKGSLDEISGFILMSDGSENSLYDKQKRALAPSVKRLFLNCVWFHKDAAEKNLQNVLDNLISKKTMDDCSIVVMADSEDFTEFICDTTAAKVNLYNISGADKNKKAKVTVYDNILTNVKHPMSVKSIGRKLHIKESAVHRKLENLRGIGLVVYEDGKYISSRFSEK